MSVSASQVRKIMRASVWARNIATVVMVWMALMWGIGLLVTAGVIRADLLSAIDRHFFPITELDSWPFRLWAMLGGLFIWLLPFANALIFMAVGHDSTASHPKGAASDGFSSIYYGGIVIFLSRIMAVGLGVREDAEELRRDAELVV